MTKEKTAVLLVDDSEHDRFFMGRAFSQSPKLTVVWEACDGEEAVAYLNGQATFADRQKYPFPDVLVLDLKMPRLTGHDVLRWLLTQRFAKPIVIVLSGSTLPEDIAQSIALGARAYYKKSAVKEELETMVSEIEKIVEEHGQLKVETDTHGSLPVGL